MLWHCATLFGCGLLLSETLDSMCNGTVKQCSSMQLEKLKGVCLCVVVVDGEKSHFGPTLTNAVFPHMIYIMQ